MPSPCLRAVELPGHPDGVVTGPGRQRIEIAVVVRGDLPPLTDEAAKRVVVEVLQAHIEAKADALAGVAPEGIRLDRRVAAAVVGRVARAHRAGAVKRQPQRQAVHHALVADGFVGVVAPPQRHGAAHRLKVVAPPAAGARVDEHVRMPAAQFVPVGEVARDVPDFA